MTDSSSKKKKKSSAASSEAQPTWKPTEESKKKAGTNRLISWILWIAAIAVEVLAIVFIVPEVGFQDIYLWFLIGALVVTAILAIVANLLWRQANQLDPASEKNKVAWFIQNQLGVIMTLIAFVPLIIIIFANKDMNNQQKSLAGIVGIVLMLIAGWTGVELNQASQEKYGAETALVAYYTGDDTVYWVPNGGVYHLCEEVSYLANSTDIRETTVQEAIAAGKNRLALNANLNACGIEGTQLSAGDTFEYNGFTYTVPAPTDKEQ